MKKQYVAGVKTQEVILLFICHLKELTRLDVLIAVLFLKKSKDIKGKHRYLYFIGTKKQKKIYFQNLKYKPKPYPKRQNKNYVVDHKTQTQALLF